MKRCFSHICIFCREERRQRDKLAPIRELINLFASRCRACYIPSAYVTVDEQLIRFRGRCPFRVYMPKKPGRYGIKVWLLNDSKNAYTYNIQIYLGKQGHLPEVGLAKRVVLDLCRPLFGSGRNVTVDNYFSSVPLAKELLLHRMSILGTMRINKPEIPDTMRSSRGRHIHSSTFGFDGLLTICSYMNKRKKLVTMLSTMHHEVAVDEGEGNDRKPVMVLDYNSTKGAVDSCDERVQTYSCNRKTNRWPLKIFFNCVDLATLNAFILWRTMHPEEYRGKLQARRLFINDLCEELIVPIIEARAIIPQLQESVRHAIVTSGLVSQASSINEAPASVNDGKLRRCSICTTRRLVRKVCDACHRPVCSDHAFYVCSNCNNS